MNILLIEDNDGDIELTDIAFRRSKIACNLAVVHDGVEALNYLSREGAYCDAVRPDIVLLDLNMPRMSGRRFLEIVKQDENLKTIPAIVLSSSNAPMDIAECYERHANCYILKPFDLDSFVDMAHQVEKFWLDLVRLPDHADARAEAVA